jgi:hypothetical protein
MSDRFAGRSGDEPDALSPAEQALLAVEDSTIPAPPNRNRLLAAVYAAEPEIIKETAMVPNMITRLFAGKNPVVRLALGALCLATVVTLSLVLPRGGSISPVGTAWAAAEGYMLTFDFGEGSTQDQVQPILDQLHAKVTEFKKAHNIPLDREHKIGSYGEKRVVKRIEKHGDGPEVESKEEHSRVIVMVALPNGDLLDELQTELATIPGLPDPAQTNATWFTENGLPDPGRPGINLALDFNFSGEGASEPHMFYFPQDATEDQIESEINGWLTTNKPDFKGAVNVTLKHSEGRTELSVDIQGKPREMTVNLVGPAGN